MWVWCWRVTQSLQCLSVIPIICELIVSQSINMCVDQNSNLAGLDLADWANSNTRLEVDILVGADYYWNLVVIGATARMFLPLKLLSLLAPLCDYSHWSRYHKAMCRLWCFGLTEWKAFTQWLSADRTEIWSTISCWDFGLTRLHWQQTSKKPF